MTPQSVNLTDRIPWQWYLVAAAIPGVGQLVGAVAGIVFMARSKIGPALALWATCSIAAGLWGGVGFLVVAAQASRDDSASAIVTRAEAPPAPTFDEGSSAVDPQPEPDATPPSEPAAARSLAGTSGKALSSCGNLVVKGATTTCPFAQNVFYEYWSAVKVEGYADDISAYSSALGRWLPVSCRDAGTVVCTTDQGSEVRISRSALSGYTQSMADAYAAEHTVHGG
jgi:hypothetical protein